MISRNNVQCIVQGEQKDITLVRGSVVQVEKYLDELNLVKCRILVNDSWVSVIIPKDAITKNFEYTEKNI